LRPIASLLVLFDTECGGDIDGKAVEAGGVAGYLVGQPNIRRPVQLVESSSEAVCGVGKL
jgi:hypothetical protein